MPVDNPNVGIAFGAVIAAGASTALGSAVVFFPKLVKLASKNVLASSLGISAGVMTYVSFVEIFQKSVGSFIDAGHDESRANIYATLSFFLGVVVMLLLDVIVKRLGHQHHHDQIKDTSQQQQQQQQEIQMPHCVSCVNNENPAQELEKLQNFVQAEDDKQKGNVTIGSNSGVSAGNNSGKDLEDNNVDDISSTNENVNAIFNTTPTNVPMVDTNAMIQEKENKKLVNMGYQTALAIALHNFPEGLATFVAVLDDPKVGAILAIAIAMHNIPEGFCVALPVYYATGDRVKGFMWGTLSGLSEPIGALLGYLVLANTMSDDAYAIIFGLVGGMMVMISLKELLPTAHRYDPTDTVVTYSITAGMVLMALSLVLFYL